MSKRNDLVKNNKYACIFINHDQTKAERQMAQNFRTILGAMKDSCIRMVGSRIMKSSFIGERHEGLSSRDNSVNTNFP